MAAGSKRNLAGRGAPLLQSKFSGSPGVAVKVEGKVIQVRPDGTLTTDITSDRLHGAPQDESVIVACGGHETVRIFRGPHQEPPFTLIARIGDEGKLELEIVGDSAAAMLGIRPGESVEVRW